MFDLEDYLNLKEINSENSNENRLIDLFLNMGKFINTDKMENDINALKDMLMKIARLYEKKIIFVVDKDKVEMFEAIE